MIILGLILLFIVGVVAGVNLPKDKVAVKPEPVTNINVDTSKLERLIDALPSQLLTSITNTSNTHKGKLGELIGYISIKGEYDRLIPLGNIVDFVGISFGTSTSPGKISFIDIKTGKHARLNADQRSLRNLIKDKKIEFIEYCIDEVTLGEEDKPPAD